MSFSIELLHYIVAHALVAIVPLTVSMNVFLRSPRTLIYRLFLFYNSAISWWGFFTVLMVIAPSREIALVWDRISLFGIVFIPIFSLHFTLVFLGKANYKKRLISTCYTLSVIFLILSFTPLMARDVSQKGYITFFTDPGVLYHYFVIFFTIMLLFVIATIYKSYLLYKGTKRGTGIFHFLIATTLATIGGGGNFLLAYNLALPIFVPFGSYLVVLYGLVTAYVILRYRLLDIRIILTRTTLLVLLYAFVLGVPLLLLGARPAIEGFFGSKWWAIPLTAYTILATAGPFIFLFFQRKAEARILRDQRKYQRTLLNASTGMTRIKELDRLLSVIAYMITKEVRLTHAGVFLWDAEFENYVLRSARGLLTIKCGLCLGRDNALIMRLISSRDVLILDELDTQLVSEGREKKSSMNLPSHAVLETMKAIDSHIVVPSFAEDRLLGFMILGEKKSGEHFTSDDLSVFMTLANQAAIAIENALYFEELKTNEAFMIQSEKLATMGQLAGGVAHEINNPLTVISGETQLLLMDLKNPPELKTTEERDKFFGEVKRNLESTLHEVNRASDIIHRILKFSRVSREGFVPVDMQKLIDDTLVLAGYQHNMKSFNVNKEIQEQLPHVYGNVNQMQEVFLNLAVNACQAMGGTGSLSVMARAVPMGHHTTIVEVRISDTGPGIPPGKLRKIFDPFFTTKDNGTGLGLFVTQRIVKAHGGTINADSVVGKGTIFTVRLPTMKDQTVPAIA